MKFVKVFFFVSFLVVEEFGKVGVLLVVFLKMVYLCLCFIVIVFYIEIYVFMWFLEDY